MTEAVRSRTHEWTSPMEMAAWARSLSAPEFFTAWSRGEVVPPMAATLGFELASFEDGRVEIVCTPDEFQYNPYGTIHGGLAATLLDTATGCAVHTRLPAGTGYATLSLSVDFLRPITTETGTVRCTGSVVSMGKRVAVAEGILVDSSERMLARGSATCLLIEGVS
jgi:uncharacterized protein (TIGR00369 family)